MHRFKKKELAMVAMMGFSQTDQYEGCVEGTRELVTVAYTIIREMQGFSSTSLGFFVILFQDFEVGFVREQAEAWHQMDFI